MVDFIVTLLQRACVGVDQVTDPSAESPVESQTLSMAMGLVATMLSGPQVLTPEAPHTNMLLCMMCFFLSVNLASGFLVIVQLYINDDR